MATIKRRGAAWQVRYRGPDGRERSKTFPRKVDAELWVATQRADFARGEWVDPQKGRIRLADWIERWEPTQLDLRPTTLALNRGVVRKYLLPRFGLWPVAEIKTSDVQAMVAEELVAGDLSPSAIRRHVIVLSTILNGAVADGRLARNPCQGVKLPPERKRSIRVLEPEEIWQLAAAVPPHYAPLILTAAYSGLRWGELAGLGLEHVDLLHHRLIVERQLVEVNGKVSFGPPKTKASIRSVSIPHTIETYLDVRLGADAARSSGLVFPTPSGAPMRRSNWSTIWRKAIHAAGFEGLRFHELRHTAVALAISQGAHPLAIRERLGHSSITVTMDTYGHLFPRIDEEIAVGLEELLAPPSAQ